MFLRPIAILVVSSKYMESKQK